MFLKREAGYEPKELPERAKPGLTSFLGLSLALHMGIGMGLRGYGRMMESRPVDIRISREESGSGTEMPASPEPKTGKPETENVPVRVVPNGNALSDEFLYPKPIAQKKHEQQAPSPPPQQSEEDLYVAPKSEAQALRAILEAKGEKQGESAPSASGTRQLYQKKKVPRLYRLTDTSAPTTFEELLADQHDFIERLKFDMNNDPPGQIRLESMSFIEFFVRSWYYNYAIGKIREGRRIKIMPADLYQSFDKIMEAAYQKIKSEHTPLQKMKIFRAAMMSYFEGYQRDAASIADALYSATINCNSGTKVGLSGYTLLAPEAELGVNVTLDHIQSAYFDRPKNQWFVVENSGPVDGFETQKLGRIVKPEGYVVAYLRMNGVHLDRFPAEVKRWYRYPWPNIMGIYQPTTGLPLVLESAFGSPPPAEFMAFGGLPSFSDMFSISNFKGTRESLVSFLRNAIPKIIEISPGKPHEAGKREGRLKELTAKEARRKAWLAAQIRMSKDVLDATDQKKVYDEMRSSIDTRFNLIDLVISDVDLSARLGVLPSDDIRQKTRLEAEGAYEREKPDYPAGELSLGERPILGDHLLKADPKSWTIGLLEDLDAGNAVELGALSVAILRIPEEDWNAIAEKILDNRVLLSDSERKSVASRGVAFRRALIFAGTGARPELDAIREKRLEAIETLIKGGSSAESGALFRTHAGFEHDPLVPLHLMARDSRYGIALSALEDMLSFKGERYAVSRIIGYLDRPDLLMGRISTGRLLIALDNRLAEENPIKSLMPLLDSRTCRADVKAGIAQFLFKKGVKDERIPKVLEHYLKGLETPAREEVVNLAQTGLGFDRAKLVMRRKFDSLLAIMKNERYDIDGIKHFIEGYETLAALGDGHGFKKMLEEYEFATTAKGMYYAVMPAEDLIRLLLRHDRYPDRIVPALLRFYREYEYGKYGYAYFSIGRYAKKLSERYSKNEYQEDFEWEAKDHAFMPDGEIRTSIGHGPIRLIWSMVREGYADKAIEFFTKITEDRAYGYLMRLNAAVSLYHLGKPRLARDVLIRLANESCESVISEENDHTIRDAFIPLHFLSEFGVTKKDHETLRRLVGWQKTTKKAMCFRDYFAHQHEDFSGRDVHYPKEWFREKPGMRSERTPYSNTINTLLCEFGFEASRAAVAKHMERIARLGIATELFRTERFSLYLGLEHPYNLNVINRYESEDNEPGIFSFIRRLPPKHLSMLLRKIDLGREKISLTALNLLFVKGYIDIDDKGDIVFRDPPKPIRPHIEKK